jgi:hypothetical protein
MTACYIQTLPVSRNVVTSRCIVVLFGTSLSGYTLLNASRTAANDFGWKQCSRMNTRSAREYTVFAATQLLLKWREQWPSNKGDLDSNVTGEVGRVYYTGMDLLPISCLYRSTWMMFGCILNGTFYIKCFFISYISYKGVESILLAQDGGQWCDSVNTIVNLRVT